MLRMSRTMHGSLASMGGAAPMVSPAGKAQGSTLKLLAFQVGIFQVLRSMIYILIYNLLGFLWPKRKNVHPVSKIHWKLQKEWSSGCVTPLEPVAGDSWRFAFAVPQSTPSLSGADDISRSHPIIQFPRLTAGSLPTYDYISYREIYFVFSYVRALSLKKAWSHHDVFSIDGIPSLSPFATCGLSGYFFVGNRWAHITMQYSAQMSLHMTCIYSHKIDTNDI